MYSLNVYLYTDWFKAQENNYFYPGPDGFFALDQRNHIIQNLLNIYQLFTMTEHIL
jgi:hypothetical protein